VAKTGNDTTGNGTQALPYLTISKALLAATDGAKIRVSPGTYQENVSMGKINVSLIGENPGTTIVKNPAANNSTSAFAIS
jgi:pectin methylesterase-like acyl-CoA thioesterase